MKTCPLCGCDQSEALLCHNCTSALERDLGDVAAIVGELDVTLSKQARVGNAGPSGLARERTPIAVGAIDPIWVLTNVLGTWARDVSGETWLPKTATVIVKRSRYATTEGPFCLTCVHRSCQKLRSEMRLPAPSVAVQCAGYLLSEIPAIRRHPAVEELMDEISDAIRLARRTVDRPSDRQFVGPCMAENPDDQGRAVTCLEDLYARHGASEVRCKVCGTEHPVAERRAWLLDQARDRLFTVREAAQMMGSVGGITVTEASIRGYLHRGRLAYRSSGNVIRLGDLLSILINESERKSA